MHFNGTVTISIILAICALFAPSITALINNHHNFKIRQLELRHNEHLRNADIQYHNKFETYNAFIKSAGQYTQFNELAKDYADILSCTQAAILLCDSETYSLLLELLDLIESSSTNRKQEKYVELLTAITKSFNRELASLSGTNNG